MMRLGRVLCICAAPFCTALVFAQVVPGQYILELNAPPAPAAKQQKPGAARAAARSPQQDVRDEVAQRGGRVIASLNRVVNAVIAEIPGADAKALAAIPQVRAVYPVRIYRMHLDRALDVHHVFDAWGRIGGPERAGAGIKIAILDTGIDINHPGFQDESLPIPAGYPKVDTDANAEFTNHKVIVARSYRKSTSAADGHGHGTAVAMIAAGVRHAALGGTLSGFAPAAYLGNYKVLNNAGTTTNATVLEALDDAVADGMDVVNLSLGDPAAPRPADDPLARAIETASAAGVIVVVSAGNEGPDPNTIDSPGTSLSAITVGAIQTAVGTAMLDGSPDIEGTLPSGAGNRGSITASVVNVADIDQTGLACGALPPGSVLGRIALIVRGDCTFEQKLRAAEAAGAAAALLYTNDLSPARPRAWLAGSSHLPAMIVSYVDGQFIRSIVADHPGMPATLLFQGNTLTAFSSRGPGPDAGLKPDITALGYQVLTAGEPTIPSGALFARERYLVASGTSFSAPMVAGAAAVVKAVRPGLTTAQYRSLIINSSTLLPTGEPRSRVQQVGAGVLDVSAALRNTLAVAPTSISLGSGGIAVDLYRDILITNVGAEPEQVSFRLDTVNGPVPSLDQPVVAVGPGETTRVTMELFATDLVPGEYQGFLEVRGEQSGTLARVPYWYGVPSGAPAYLTLLFAPDSQPAGSTTEIYFRPTDQSGLPVPATRPEVTVLAGGGEVLEVADIDSDVPGAFRARVRLGPDPGANRFDIRVSGVPSRPIQIDGYAAPILP